MEMQQLEHYVKQAKQGDHEAFAKIYTATYSKASYIVKSILRDYSEEDWKDTLQNAYMTMLVNLEQYVEGNSFQAWFLKIVKNTAINYDKQHNKMYLQNVDAIIDAIADSDDTPEKLYSKQETRKLIEEHLRLLSPQQREAMTLFYFEDLPMKEIAKRMGINENTVKTHLRRGREQLEIKLLAVYPKDNLLNGVLIMPLLVSMLEKDVGAGLAVFPENIIEAVTSTAANTTGAAGTATATTAGTAATATTGAAISNTGIGALVMGLGAGAKAGIITAAAVVIIGGVAVPVYLHNENQRAVQAMAIVQQEEEAAEQSRIEAEAKAASEKAASEKAASEKAESEKAEAERKAAEEKAASEKAEQERIEIERIEAEKAEAERIEQEQAAAQAAAVKAQQDAVAAQQKKEEAAASSSVAAGGGGTGGTPDKPLVENSNPQKSASSKAESSEANVKPGKPAPGTSNPNGNGMVVSSNGQYYVQPGGPFAEPSAKVLEASGTDSQTGVKWFTKSSWMSDIGAWRGTDLNGKDVLLFPGGNSIPWKDYTAIHAVK